MFHAQLKMNEAPFESRQYKSLSTHKTQVLTCNLMPS